MDKHKYDDSLDFDRTVFTREGSYIVRSNMMKDLVKEHIEARNYRYAQFLMQEFSEFFEEKHHKWAAIFFPELERNGKLTDWNINFKREGVFPKKRSKKRKKS